MGKVAPDTYQRSLSLTLVKEEAHWGKIFDRLAICRLEAAMGTSLQLQPHLDY